MIKGMNLVRGLFVFLSLALVVTSCAGKAPPDSVNVGFLRIMSHGALFVAMERGYWKEQNLEVKLEDFKAGGDMIPFISRGDLDVAGGSSGAALLNALNSNINAKLVATISTQPDGPNSVALVVRKSDFDSGKVKNVADLKGKKCGINAKGGAAEMLADKALQQGGLTLKDTEVVVLDFPDQITALANNAIDAALLPEPFTTRAEDMGIGYRLVSKIAPRDQSQLLLFSEKFIKERPEVAKRFMIGYLRGIRQLARTNWKDDADAEAVAKWTNLKADIVKRAVPPGQDPDGKLSEASLEEQQIWYMSHGYLKYKDPLNIRGHIDYSFVDHAKKQLGEFKP